MIVPEFTLNSALANDFRVESPVTHEGDLVAAQTETGALELFAIGSDSSVSRFYQTGDDTGWAVEAVPGTDNSSGLVALPVPEARGDRDRVFSVSRQPPPSRPDYGDWTFNEIAPVDAGGFGVRRISRIGVSEPALKGSITQVRAYLGNKGISLTARAAASCRPQMTTFLPDDGEADKWARPLFSATGDTKHGITGAPAFFFASAGGGADQPNLPVCFTQDGNALLGWGAFSSGNLDAYEVTPTTSPPPLPGKSASEPGKINLLAPFTSRDGDLRLVASATNDADPAHRLFAISPEGPVHLNDLPTWPAAWDGVDLALTPEGDGPEIHRARGILTAVEEAVLFTDTDKSGGLWVTMRGPEGYARPTRLEEGVSNFCLAEDGDGCINVFAVTEAQGLIHFVRRGAEWTRSEVDLPTGKTAAAVILHRSSAVLYDTAHKAVIPGRQVTITTDKTVYATINGKMRCLHAGGAGITVPTNALGRIVVTQEIFGNNLSAAELTFTTADAAAITAKSNNSAVDYLRDVGWKVLESALDPLTGKNVVKKKYRNEASLKVVAQTIQGCVEMYDFRTIEPQKSKAPPRPWMFDGTGDAPVFRYLEPDEAERIIAEMRSQRAVGAPEDLWDDIGDAFGAVESGAAELTKIVFGPEEAVFSFALDKLGVNISVLTGAFSWALDALGGVFSFFGDGLGTGIGWLLKVTGDFTGWNGVVANAKKLRSQLKSTAAAMPAEVKQVSAFEALATIWLDEQQAEFDKAIDFLISKVGGEPTSSFNSGDRTDAQMLSLGTDGSNDTFFDYLGKLIEIITEELLGFDLGTPPLVEEFETLLSTLADEMVQNLLDLAQKVVGDLEGLLTSSQSFADATMAALLEIVRDVADTVFTLLKQLVTFFGDVVKLLLNGASDVVAWLDSKISVPFFSAMITESSDMRSSFVTIVTLLTAMPMTIASAVEAEPGKTDWGAWVGKLVSIIVLGYATTTGDIIGFDPPDKERNILAMVANVIAAIAGAVGSAIDFSLDSSDAEHAFWGLALMATMLDLIMTGAELKFSEMKWIGYLRIGILSVAALAAFIYCIVMLATEWDDLKESERAGYFMTILGCLSTWWRILPAVSDGNEVDTVFYGAAELITYLSILGAHLTVGLLGEEDDPDGALA